MFEIRTDLAVETSEKRPDGKEISGLLVEKEKRGEDITITKVRIETQKAAKTMGKPRGTYISIEADQMMEEDNDYIGDWTGESGGDAGCTRTESDRSVVYHQTSAGRIWKIHGRIRRMLQY